MLQQICYQVQQESCNVLAHHFSQTSDELQSESSLFLHRRRKRGAINLIGNAAKALFGVLDSEYAEQMSQTILNIDNNEQYMINLIQNQTSIIDSTINIIKIDQEVTKTKFDAIDKSLDDLKNHIESNKQALKEQISSQALLSIAIHLIMTTLNLRNVESAILSVLTDAHHGKIGPLLLSPNQLKSEITKIKGHLPPSTQFPLQQDELLSMYELMSVEAGLTNNHILFKITIPLTGAYEFNMYKVIPIPVSTNGTLMAIQPTTEILAITAHGDKYFPMTQQQYKNCKMLNQEVYLCPHTQSIYNKGSNSNACEVNLFNNETKLLCNVIETPNDQWTQLDDKNHWLFALRQSIKLTAVCGKETSQIRLEGSGIFKMKPECVIKNGLFTILGNQIIQSTLRESITTHGQWTQLHDPKTSEQIKLEDAIKPYHTEIKDLMALQKVLDNQQILQLPSKLRNTNTHLFGVGYTALLVAIISAIYIIVTKCRKLRSHPDNQIEEEARPKPAPRYHDFSIHV